MKICSVTLCPRSQDAEEAIATVRDLVDGSLTSIQEGPIKDFAQARNDTLAMAAEDFGYDWAIMLDTDERIQTHERFKISIGDLQWDLAGMDLMKGSGFQEMLEATDADILMVPHVNGTYAKERIFRLPARGKYVGPTHEAWITDKGAKREVITGITFSELPKTPEQYRAKVERDREILEAYTRDHPDDPRWWYYLGDTYAGLGQSDDAKKSFVRCYNLDGWDEESAWAAYRLAVLWSSENPKNGIHWCLQGMRRRADFPEFPWLAGWCCYQLGRYEQAVYWELLAVDLQHMPKFSDRIIFRYPPAHYEGPFDVLRYAYRAIGGWDSLVTHYDRVFADRKAQRERG